MRVREGIVAFLPSAWINRRSTSRGAISEITDYEITIIELGSSKIFWHSPGATRAEERASMMSIEGLKRKIATVFSIVTLEKSFF